MPEEVVGAPGASPTPQDVNPPGSSPGEPQGPPSSEPGTPQQPAGPVPAPEPSDRFDQHPRFQELRQRAQEAERRYHELVTRLQQPVQPATPSADPWEGHLNHPDPATAQFYQEQKRLMDHTVKQGRDQAFQDLQPVIASLQQEQAASTLREFRKENPDIKPGSEEERQVIAYMRGEMDGVRHPIESAKRNAMYDRLEAENRALKSKQASAQTKVAANASESSSGIPATAGLPRQPGDWRENVRQSHRKGGELVDILNAAGMSRAT